MADQALRDLAPSTEQSRIAAQQYERARQAMTSGNHDYSIELLRTCCKLDPGNLIYRKALRRTQKTKYGNNLRGSVLAWLTTTWPQARMQKAMRSGNYLKVLELGEVVLSANPWATGAQLDMAQAAEQLGLLDTAVWILEQARQKDPRDARVNRALALLYERVGNFSQAMLLWELVSKANPQDMEALRKAKDVAAQHTIAKGNYVDAAQGSRATPREVDIGPASPSGATPLARTLEPLKKKVEADPSNPIAYLQMQSALLKAGDIEGARQCLLEGLAATGQHFELQLAITDVEIEALRQNLRLTEAQLGSNPADRNLQLMRDKLSKEINSRELEAFRKKAERFPTEMSNRLELGIRLLRAGQLDEAIQELQTARKDPRTKVRALQFLGHCFRQRKNWVLARKNFSEALQSLPSGEEEVRKDLMFQLAQIAAAEQDWRSAIEIGTELADLDFGYQNIGKLLDEWESHASK